MKINFENDKIHINMPGYINNIIDEYKIKKIKKYPAETTLFNIKNNNIFYLQLIITHQNHLDI